jgi:hypothetical protein
MSLNRTGIGLIAFFLLAGLALAVVPLLAGAGGQVAAILASVGLIWVAVALGLAWFAAARTARPRTRIGSSRTASVAPPPCSTPAATRPSTRCR